MSITTIANNAITYSNGNFGIGVTNPTSDSLSLPGGTEIKGSVTCDSVALSGAFTKLTTGTQEEFKSWVQSITDDAKENWWSKAAVPRYLESTYTGTTLNGSNTNTTKYAGGVLLPDGRVVFVPRDSKVLGIYNPSSNTFTETTYTGTTLDGSNTNTTKYAGGVLLPDGRVVFVPSSSNKLGIYAPSSDTFTETTYTGTTLNGSNTNTVKYFGGVLLPDGRVVFVPQNSNKLGIYAPSSDTFTETTYTGTTLDGSNTDTYKYAGGVLIPDGRVVFVTQAYNKSGIYNPTADTYTETTYTSTKLDGTTTGDKYHGGVLLPDGRVVFVPSGSNKLGIVSGFPPVPIDRCLHPCFNKF